MSRRAAADIVPGREAADTKRSIGTVVALEIEDAEATAERVTATGSAVTTALSSMNTFCYHSKSFASSKIQSSAEMSKPIFMRSISKTMRTIMLRSSLRSIKKIAGSERGTTQKLLLNGKLRSVFNPKKLLRNLLSSLLMRLAVLSHQSGVSDSNRTLVRTMKSL
jgi:hypothetical protein